MPKRSDNKYDAIIIGAGISGLVCGCYLAKSGLKVLMVEKNSKPGGCCSSFSRDGFTFDAAAHSLGSLRKGGNLSRIFDELDLKNKLNIIRYDPSDIIISPEHKISFWNDKRKTMGELKKYFPEENKNINSFFEFLDCCKQESATSLINKTFKDTLDQFLKDDRLKTILSIVVFGNLGLPPSKVSAFTALKLYQEFILDGGYYPEGGMQELSDSLSMRFVELGGKILFEESATEIIVRRDKVKGVRLKNNNEIMGTYVISNADATYTYTRLLKNLKGKVPYLTKMKTTPSFFSVFLGLKIDADKLFGYINSTVWFNSHYDLEKMYKDVQRNIVYERSLFLCHGSSDKKSITLSIPASYKNKEYWSKNREKIANKLIYNAEKYIGGLSHHIKTKIIVSPHDIYRWTMNYKGATYGWASMPSQLAVQKFSNAELLIENFYLTGHWTTIAQGIPGVAYVGRDAANKIIRKQKGNNI